MYTNLDESPVTIAPLCERILGTWRVNSSTAWKTLIMLAPCQSYPLPREIWDSASLFMLLPGCCDLPWSSTGRIDSLCWQKGIISAHWFFFFPFKQSLKYPRLTHAFSLLERAFVHHGHDAVTPAPCRATRIGGGVLGSNESTLGAFTIAAREDKSGWASECALYVPSRPLYLLSLPYHIAQIHQDLRRWF